MDITSLAKVLVLGIVSTFVGSPLGSAPDAPTVDVPEDQGFGGNGNGNGGGGGESGSFGSDSNSQAANKVAAAGSTIEYMCVTVGDFPCDNTVTLFSESIKVSNPSDLLIEVNAECALWTEVEVVDDDDSNTPEVDVPHSESEGRVTVWVTIDGVRVGVTEYDNGEVVYCDRVHGMTLRENEGDEDNETISNYLDTRTANSFSWILLNSGDYGDGVTHLIEVFAHLEASVNVGEGSAEAAVGKRTLVVEPVMMKNNEQV